MERERETAPVQTPVSAPVYNLKIKILHFYLYKKGGEKVHRAIQGEAGESGKAIVSTGSPGPKNKSCTKQNLYLLPKGGSERSIGSALNIRRGPWNPEIPGKQIPDKICPLRRENHLNSPPPKKGEEVIKS